MKRYTDSLTILVMLVATGNTVSAQQEYPPGTFQLAPRVDLHLVPTKVHVPETFRGRVPVDPILNLPPGFQVSVFAAPSPSDRLRMMAFNDQGVLHVANFARILALPDRDDDGVADEVIVAAEGFDWINSIAFYEGALYAAETDEVIRFTDADDDLVYEDKETVADLPSAGWHISRAIVIDESKGKFYVAMGSPCDLCRLEKPVRGYSNSRVAASEEWDAILEFNLDGSGRRIFATGMRNVVGIDIHPETNELWGVHNHFDRGGTHIPPEWIDVIGDGDFMGYPLAYGYQVWIDPSIGGYDQIAPFTRQDSLTVQRMKRPVALVPAHQAPLGIHFYDHDLFPAEYRPTAFVSVHGGKADGNLSAVPGFKVIAVFSAADGSGAVLGDFLTGFAPESDRGLPWGKPVGISSDDRGRLYVSSDTSARVIFRIEPATLFGTWEGAPADSVISGERLDLMATLRLRRFAEDLAAPTASADLGAFGGPSAVELVALGDSTYVLEATGLVLDIPNGRRNIDVVIRQGPHTTSLVYSVFVIPTSDRLIFADALAPEWEMRVRLAEGALERNTVYAGGAAQAFAADGFSIHFTTDAPVDPYGYSHLRLAFHSGDATAENPDFKLMVNGDRDRAIALLGQAAGEFAVELGSEEWQVLEIPLGELADAPIEKISLSGNLKGTFYVDELALVRMPGPPETVVLEERVDEVPQSFALEQNFPNPFNSGTVIRFSLTRTETVDLSLFDQAGQKVATLLEGVRQAGTYEASWDGRGDDGETLSSGVYLYRLRAGGKVETRKLILLR